MTEDDQSASIRESAGSETVDSPFFVPRRFSLILAAAGAIEGAVVGFIHGGFPNDFCGAVIGCAIGAVMAPFVWKVHQEFKMLAPALVAVALLEIGGSLAIDLLAETYPWEAGYCAAMIIGWALTNHPERFRNRIQWFAKFCVFLGMFGGGILGMIVAGTWFGGGMIARGLGALAGAVVGLFPGVLIAAFVWAVGSEDATRRHADDEERGG